MYGDLVMSAWAIYGTAALYFYGAASAFATKPLISGACFFWAIGNTFLAYSVSSPATGAP